MTTLKDVAAAAGVSVTSASYALSGNRKVGSETRKRVLDAAEKMGYRPSGAARSLRLNKTNIIGLFVPGFSGPVFGEIMQAANDAAVFAGYELIVCVMQLSYRLWQERHVDGAVILNSFISDDMVESVQSDDFPIVVMERSLCLPHVSAVTVDNRHGGYLGVEYLAHSGRRRVAVLCGHPESHEGQARLKGVWDAIHKLGLDTPAPLVYNGGFSERSARFAMEEILHKQPDTDAVFCLNDEMAIGAMKTIQSSGRCVPEDVAVVGFDDIALGEYVQPSLTSVRVDRYEWGRLAVASLVDMIEHKSPGRSLVMPVSLTVRRSADGFSVGEKG